MTAPTMTPDSDEQADERRYRRSAPPILRQAAATLRDLPGRMQDIRLRGVSRSPWFAGIVGALWAAGIALVVAALSMVLVWVASPGSGLTLVESLRIAGLLWSVAQGAPIAIGGVTYSLLPWGLALVPVLLLAYAGGWSARRAAVASVRDLVVLVGCAVVTYTLIAVVVAHFSARPDAHVGRAEIAFHAALLASIAVGWGAWRASRDVLADVTPWWLAVTLRSGAIGALCIVGFGAVAAAAALLVRVDDVITMTQSLHAGVWGGVGLLLLGLAYAPVAIVWASAYVLGAGFTVGPSVAVSPFIPATAPTQLPSFPLLAGVPQTATPTAWALPVLGVVAGVTVGVTVARACRQESRLTRLVLAVGSAAVCGAMMFAVSLVGDGALGNVRLAHLGPSPTTVAVLAFVLVVLGAVPSAMVPAPPARPVLAVAEPLPDPIHHEDAGDAPLDGPSSDDHHERTTDV